MKRFAILACLGLIALHAEDRRVPVVVELFTSEGCSSCPSADRLLASLEHSQPVQGARIIALEEHVDYWNQLGWTDPFSGPQYRARQNDYALSFRVSEIYTPQMVINGHVEFIGDDRDRAMQEIRDAAQTQGAWVNLSAKPKDNAELVDLTVRVGGWPAGKARASQVFLAVTESDLSTNVYRGENSGRTLHHGAVVRSFGVIGRIDPKGSREGVITSTLRLPEEWKREHLQAVVFVQERDTFRITGANSIRLY